LEVIQLHAHKDIPRDFQIFAWCTWQDVRNYNNSSRIGSTSASPCAASTRLPATAALHQLRRASRLLVTRPHRLYVSLAVRREYSSPGHNDSTSTSPCVATTRHPAAQALRQPRRAPRVLVSRPRRLYIDYTVRRHDIIFWAYDYLDYLPRLVSTRKLVEDGSCDLNN
jgi:hypothetical protein